MCRMAFMISDKGHITGLDSAVFDVWKKSNPHGIGTLFRDKKSVFHLNRYSTSDSYKTIKHAYDRFLFHIRFGTGGDGTHPFTCSHAPNWYMIHNGTLKAKGRFRKTLGRKGHEYLTGIDSENFAHIWGDIYDNNKNIGDLAVKMMSKVRGIIGKKDVILYNNVTDEWVLISMGRLQYIETDGFFLVASDFKFFPELKPIEIESGTILYGKGTKILGERKWDTSGSLLPTVKWYDKIGRKEQRALDDDDDEDFDEGYNGEDDFDDRPKHISEDSYTIRNENSHRWL